MIRITDGAVQPFEKEHVERVRAAAPECTLFLKKDADTLPVSPCKAALYGSGARRTIKGGTGSGDVNVRAFTTIEEGLEKAGFTITTKAWMDAYDKLMTDGRVEFVKQVKKEAAELGINPVMYGMGKAMPEPEYDIALEGEGELAIYVLSRNSGEGSDRSKEAGDINLTQTEIRDIKACQEKYEKFVLVLNVGGMVNLEPVMDVKNILLLGQLGSPIGDVLADILTGKSNPSGKLAMTWAPIDDYPSTKGFGDMDDTIYTEDIYVGYRYFDTAKENPTFPFGYGLSYTDFEIGEAKTTLEGSKVTVEAKVKNTGSFAGKEVVQLYVSIPSGKLNQAYQGLAAFAKTALLNPGEEKTAVLSFDLKEIASYEESSASYLLEAGEYVLRIGNASRNTTVCAALSLAEEVIVKQCRNICPVEGERPDFMKLPAVTAELPADCPVYTVAPESFSTVKVEYTESLAELPNTLSCTFKDVKDGKASLDQLVGSLSNEELAHLCIGYYEENAGMGSIIGSSAGKVAGAAGETTGHLAEQGIPSAVMADGPAGIRVNKEYKVVKGKVKGIGNSLEGMADFMEPEQLKQMAAMMPKPTEEELAAPVNYMYCTAIPIGTALAQSFSTKICEALGDMVGEEMEMFGVQLWLAPAMNIQRSPLCGRDFEYYSEDPVVSGQISAAITRGVQKHPGCGTTIKHYTMNNQESNRTASNSIVSERAMREIYLRNFEISIREAAPMAVMSSYNLVNGEHTNNSKDLINYVMRDEWGYEGLVMTDWFAVGGFMAAADTRVNKHPIGDQAGCIYAGNDLIMPGMAKDFEAVCGAIDNAEVKYPINRAMLQRTAKRVLKTLLDCEEQ